MLRNPFLVAAIVEMIGPNSRPNSYADKSRRSVPGGRCPLHASLHKTWTRSLSERYSYRYVLFFLRKLVPNLSLLVVYTNFITGSRLSHL